ncbi:DUF4349 domain-containing protein [soil metagenome]
MSANLQASRQISKIPVALERYSKVLALGRVNSMKCYLFLIAFATLAFATGCGAQMDSASAGTGVESAKASADSTLSGNAPPPSASARVASNETQSIISNRKVIRTATISVRVDDIEKAEKVVNQSVNKVGGFVDNATSSDLASDNPKMDIRVRIPVAQFDNIISGFEKLGVRLGKSISSQDVTEQVVDMDARLKSMVAEEDSIRAMLKNAHDMNSVIALQDKLVEIRSAIESLAGQRKSLASQAAFSTITLTLQQSATINAAPKDPNWLTQAWGESTGSLGGVARGLAVLFVWLATFSPIWLPILWLVIRARRRKPASNPLPPVFRP